MASASRGPARDVFSSVFAPTDFTTPTPESTPVIGGLASPGQPFGGFNSFNHPSGDTIKFHRAWSTATRYLSLSDEVTNAVSRSRDTLQAFHFLGGAADTLKDLIAWYRNETNDHFRTFILPELREWQQPVPLSKAWSVLETTLEVLRRAQQHYLRRLESLLELPVLSTAEEQIGLRQLLLESKRNLHLTVVHSLPSRRVQSTIASVFYQHMKASLEANSNPEMCRKAGRCQCTLSLDKLPLASIQSVGLGDHLGERAFALAVNRLLGGSAIQTRCFQVNWTEHTSVVSNLHQWVMQVLTPFIEQSLRVLTAEPSLSLPHNDIKGFAAMGVANLGRQRTLTLFDYVKTWPQSRGAILDIKEYLASGDPSDKVYVCAAFSTQIQQRLLHAGASTTEILSIYINTIHAFKALDARGVLLEKVAVPIRNCLRARDDTVSIIAASFLCDTDEDGNVTHADLDKVCPDIIAEVANSSIEDRQDQRMLSWNDMDWIPDPIDAGPDYRASRTEDGIAYILGLFEQEEFVNEVTNVLAQHLLQVTDSEYVKEIRLVELFKSRLDATKLQAAEVMLKDVRDSVGINKRINPSARYDVAKPPTPREIQAAIPEDGITMQSLYRTFRNRISHGPFLAIVKLIANRRQDMLFPKRTRLPAEPKDMPEPYNDFKVQVLSSFFWPEMRSNEFQLPSGFDEARVAFEEHFQRLGGQRKLLFRPALARVTVELELDDRHVKHEGIPAWRGSVIDAFGSEQGHDPTVGLTAPQLMDALGMDEELVLDALSFWTGERVLYQVTPGAYAVLERLDMDVGAAQQSAPPPTETISAVKTADAMLQESAPMFTIFIANMLKNGGPKEVAGMMGITNMLKMVLPTFTYGEDEVDWLLGEMEGRGEVVRNGETWAAA